MRLCRRKEVTAVDFNNKLYTLRKQKGYSQEELANRLNVSRQTISKWEVGDSTPDMEKLVAISEKVLTDENKKKAKKGLKIAAVIAGAVILIDVISAVVYFTMYGFPK